VYHETIFATRINLDNKHETRAQNNTDLKIPKKKRQNPNNIHLNTSPQTSSSQPTAAVQRYSNSTQKPKAKTTTFYVRGNPKNPALRNTQKPAD